MQVPVRPLVTHTGRLRHSGPWMLAYSNTVHLYSVQYLDTSDKLLTIEMFNSVWEAGQGCRWFYLRQFSYT